VRSSRSPGVSASSRLCVGSTAFPRVNVEGARCQAENRQARKRGSSNRASACFGVRVRDVGGGAQGRGVTLLVFSPEAFEQRQVHQVFLPATGLLAGNDVAQVRHPEDAFRQGALSGFREAGNAAGDARLKPRYSGRFCSHQARYSAKVLKARHGASSSTGL
jgi:hypothetical protein